MEFDAEIFNKMKRTCMSIIQNPNDCKKIEELHSLIKESRPTYFRVFYPTVLATFYPIIKTICSKTSSYTENERRTIIDTLSSIFSKIIVEKEGLFINIYSLLLFEVYDPKTHKVLDIHEEYKLSIMKCMINLSNAVGYDLIPVIYKKQNATKLCQMLYVAIEIAKNEQFRDLKIAAMECIMSLARVSNDSDFSDRVMREKIAATFIFFLPGIICALKTVALSSETIGHKVPLVAVKAWGRIAALLMADYGISPPTSNTHPSQDFNKELKPQDVGEYLQRSIRTPEWLKEADGRLEPIARQLTVLTGHSHYLVRRELAHTCSLLQEDCSRTLPKSLSVLIEIIITLSEDENEEVANISKSSLSKLADKLSYDEVKQLFDNLEENFYTAIAALPRKFNGINEREQLSAINLVIGYVNLFGDHNLTHVFSSSNHLDRLLSTLLHISQLKRSDIHLIQETCSKDLLSDAPTKTSWKQFHYFTDERIENKLKHLCSLFVKHNAIEITSDYLLDAFLYQQEKRKEATLLLNYLLTAEEFPGLDLRICKTIITTYLEKKNWHLTLTPGIDEEGYEYTLNDVQDNALQVALLVEGIGKAALALGSDFRQLLFLVLYPVLERAGSGQPVIRTAGMGALLDITYGCGYETPADLVAGNMDYLLDHIESKLKRLDEETGVLNVLTAVFKYSNADTLTTTLNIISQVLHFTKDTLLERNISAYLRVFLLYLQHFSTWFPVNPAIQFLTREEKTLSQQNEWQVTGGPTTTLNDPVDLSDEGVMGGKTAEEMYKEDMENREASSSEEQEPPELDDSPPRPSPPRHIKLAAEIVHIASHQLPSRNTTRKFLALELLPLGLEALSEWEDELLPAVHQVWGPLVPLFHGQEYLVLAGSFKLLLTMARLSKEFIRSRTAKEVLPYLTAVLCDLAKESQLKDRGSAYRYTQAYKLQLLLLGQLATLLIDLDLLDRDYEGVFKGVMPYLSDKQPVPLQTEAVNFFRKIYMYDKKILEDGIKLLWGDNKNDGNEKNVTLICNLMNEGKIKIDGVCEK